jgi:hypothetical protein
MDAPVVTEYAYDEIYQDLPQGFLSLDWDG